MLVVEDSPDDAELILRALRAGGFAPHAERVETLEAVAAALDRGRWDVVISDYYLPGLEAPEVLAFVRERAPDTPFLVVSGSVGEEHAVAAMKAGAHDYVMKDRLARLAPAVERELREAATRRERRLLEEQLRQAQKMDAIGRLAGGVAHDMNNLLTALLGSSELLLLDLGDGPVREEVTEMRAVAERAAALVRQLLAFSRRQVLEPRELDLNTLVAECGKMLRRLIGEHIELRVVAGQGLGVVRADPGQLEQVIVNLVVNARDAMPEGGRLTIETANAELDTAYARRHAGVTPGRYVMVAVSDTGVGMDAMVQARLFEPFFTTKPRGKGTGLGLATVYGIIKQSGGNVFVYSEPGKGATFKVYLPRVEASAAARAPGPTGPARGGTETVLVVEDEPVVRALARKVLAHYGYRVLDASSGSEALALVRGDGSSSLSLLLTDVVMPEISGRELMRRVAELRPGVKVLYMSGYTDDAVVRHGVLDPGTAFIQKPFTPDGLARKVRDVLDGVGS